MPTTRTPKARTTKPKITPRIIAAYKRALELYHRPIEHAGLHDARLALHRMLGRMPWEADVFDTVDCDRPPMWMTDDYQIASWLSARFIFEQLDEHVYPSGKVMGS